MAWNWQISRWPDFRYDAASLAPFEQRFLMSSGEIKGAVRHLCPSARDQLRIDLLSDEIMATCALEGEMLDRRSLQSSVRRHLGLEPDSYLDKPREQGVVDMMVDIYATYAEPLEHETLFRWHQRLFAFDTRLKAVGSYRQHVDAPPSAQVRDEMDRYVNWFNRTGQGAEAPLPALTRAGLGHLYFETLRPFENGNGRLGRALTEKSLAQNIGRPSRIALSHTLARKRKDYDDQLGRHKKTLDVTPWLVWFAEAVVQAQQVTLDRVGFFITKAHFYDRYRDALNDRQAKVIERMFQEGPDGFKGGLSAEIYISICATSRASATRDLQELVGIGAIVRRGERRYTRYWLNLQSDQTEQKA